MSEYEFADETTWESKRLERRRMWLVSPESQTKPPETVARELGHITFELIQREEEAA